MQGQRAALKRQKEGGFFSDGPQGTRLVQPRPSHHPLLSVPSSFMESASPGGSRQDSRQALSPCVELGGFLASSEDWESSVQARNLCDSSSKGKCSSSRGPQRPWQAELSPFPEEEQRARTGACPRDLDPLDRGESGQVELGGWRWGPANFGCLDLSPATAPKFSTNWAQILPACGLQARKYSG